MQCNAMQCNSNAKQCKYKAILNNNDASSALLLHGCSIINAIIWSDTYRLSFFYENLMYHSRGAISISSMSRAKPKMAIELDLKQNQIFCRSKTRRDLEK